MQITLDKILKLDIFKNSTILAGYNGINNIVHRVSVFDCPINVERDCTIFKSGDLFITNFFFLKNNTDEILKTLNFLKSSGCAGLLVTTEYIDNIFSDLIEYSNKLNLPIISFDYNIPYTEIIFSISNLIVEGLQNNILELQLSNLMSSSNIHTSQNILNSLNPHFLEYTSAIYCYSDDCSIDTNANFIKLISKDNHNMCISYKGGLLILITYSNLDSYRLNSKLKYFLDILTNNLPNYKFGISKKYIDLVNVRDAISQAILASSYSDFNFITDYNNLGIVSFLLSFKNSPELKDFYNSTIIPIVEYDKSYNKDLLKTIITFVDCGGDVKLVSSKLFQHENTIRYRLLKVRSILDIPDSNVEFFERISIATKLHKLYQIEKMHL